MQTGGFEMLAFPRSPENAAPRLNLPLLQLAKHDFQRDLRVCYRCLFLCPRRHLMAPHFVGGSDENSPPAVRIGFHTPPHLRVWRACEQPGLRLSVPSHLASRRLAGGGKCMDEESTARKGTLSAVWGLLVARLRTGGTVHRAFPYLI